MTPHNFSLVAHLLECFGHTCRTHLSVLLNELSALQSECARPEYETCVRRVRQMADLLTDLAPMHERPLHLERIEIKEYFSTLARHGVSVVCNQELGHLRVMADKEKLAFAIKNLCRLEENLSDRQSTIEFLLEDESCSFYSGTLLNSSMNTTSACHGANLFAPLIDIIAAALGHRVGIAEHGAWRWTMPLA